MKKLYTLIFSLLLATAGYAATPSTGTFYRATCSTITNPVTNKTWCNNLTDGFIYIYNGVDYTKIAGGSSTAAPADATYITQTPNGTLSNEQPLNALTAGLMKQSAGIVATAVAGVDYVTPGGSGGSVIVNAPLTGDGTSGSHIAIPAATSLANGYLTSADWTTFNAKQPAGAYLTGVTVDAPLSGAGTSGSHLLMPAATGSQNGYLTSADWTTFNNKGSGSGSVTSVAQSFTGGLISVSGSPVTTSGTLALTVAGTSGGIPYFSSASTWASSAALTAHGVIIGGGAATAPTSTGAGTSGQVLTSNGASSDPTFQAVPAASVAIGGTVTSGTAGSVLFVNSGPILAQDNANFFWDDTNNRLGIGTATPAASKIHVVGSADSNSFIRVDPSASGVNTVLGSNEATGFGYVGTNTNQPFRIRANGSDELFVGTSGGLGIGQAVVSNTYLSVVKSNATGSGVIFDMRNTNTSGSSFTQIELDANNTSVISTYSLDGLGTGSVLGGTVGGYIGTFTNHAFGFSTNNTLRALINADGSTIWGNTVAAARVRTSLAAPSSLGNGDWWVECTGTTPSRVCAVKVRDGGATFTIASVTN